MSTPGKFCAEENDDLDIGLSFDNIYKLYESESSFRLRVYAQQHEDCKYTNIKHCIEHNRNIFYSCNDER